MPLKQWRQGLKASNASAIQHTIVLTFDLARKWLGVEIRFFCLPCRGFAGCRFDLVSNIGM
jgi:hypothetical protein